MVEDALGVSTDEVMDEITKLLPKLISKGFNPKGSERVQLAQIEDILHVCRAQGARA